MTTYYTVQHYQDLKSQERSSPEKSKLILENISTISNQAIIHRILHDNPHSSHISHRRQFSLTKEAGLENRGTLLLGSSTARDQIPKPDLLKNFEKATSPEDDVLEQVAFSERKYEWSPSKEEIFRTYRETSKTVLHDKIRSSSWNEIAFSPFIQVSQIEEKNKSQRETKINKYINGDLLTPEEYKVIANSSVLLNAHVDKRFFQFIVNNIEPGTLDAVPLFSDLLLNNIA